MESMPPTRDGPARVAARLCLAALAFGLVIQMVIAIGAIALAPAIIEFQAGRAPAGTSSNGAVSQVDCSLVLRELADARTRCAAATDNPGQLVVATRPGRDDSGEDVMSRLGTVLQGYGFEVLSVRIVSGWPQETKRHRFETANFAQLGFIGVALLALSLYAVALSRRHRDSDAARPPWGSVVNTVLGLGLGVLLATGGGWFDARFDLPVGGAAGPDPGNPELAGALVVVLLIPLAEESVFRQFLISRLLEAVGRIWAVLLSSSVFALAHLPGGLAEAGYFFCGGLMLGLLWVGTRSLSACFCAHALVNLVAIQAW